MTVGCLSGLSGVFGAIAGWWLCEWVWPALEVAPPEDSSRRRALKAISPILLLIVGALVKKAFV